MTHLALTVLASGEAKKSGPIGLAVILIMCVACYFLFKSMSRHMRKVREEFPGAERLPEPDDPKVLPTASDAPHPTVPPAAPQPPADDSGA
jgi:hypothetical protein